MLVHHIGHFMARSHYKWRVDEEGWDVGPIKYCQREDCRGIYYGYHQIDRQVWLCSGYLMEAREEEDIQVRPGARHSKRIAGD